MTIYCHLLERIIMLLSSLRGSWYIGIPYPLCSIGVRVFCRVLCSSGILGKGTLRAYPWEGIPITYGRYTVMLHTLGIQEFMPYDSTI